MRVRVCVPLLTLVCQAGPIALGLTVAMTNAAVGGLRGDRPQLMDLAAAGQWRSSGTGPKTASGLSP